MNKEQKIWLFISIVSGTIFVSTFVDALTLTKSDIILLDRFYILVSAYIVTFVSFLMYAFTQYLSTREIISILKEKVCDDGD